MTQLKRHLHRDYNTSFCGRDASHILMTYDAAECDCAGCLAAYEAQLREDAEVPEDVTKH